jgi:hypothetical protein
MSMRSIQMEYEARLPGDLAYHCYRTAKEKGYSLDWALGLLAWNSVMVRWINSYTGKVGRRAFTLNKTLRAAGILIGFWQTSGR